MSRAKRTDPAFWGGHDRLDTRLALMARAVSDANWTATIRMT